MKLTGRTWLFGGAVVLIATVCVRLGFWQLDRLEERRAVNAERAAAHEAPPARVTAAGPSAAEDGISEDLAWRRVELAGRFDYAREIVLRNRSRQGTPGVYVMTPFLLPDSGAVLVLRGWLPAPDGMSASLARARPEAPAGSVTVGGIARPGSPRSGGPVDTLAAGSGTHPVLGSADLAAASRLLPYPVASYYVHPDDRPGMGGDASGGESAPGLAPRPVPLPEPDGGPPHLSYAVQWFSFATIALVGGGVLLWRRPRDGSGSARRLQPIARRTPEDAGPVRDDI